MSRTNIDIDDELMAEAIKVTGQKTKKGAVEEAMRQYLRGMLMRDLIEGSRGIGWSGGLGEHSDLSEDEAPFETKA